MHRDQAEFMRMVREAFPRHFRGARVLEIGSMDVNGSIRPLFEAREYVGVDLAPGPGVDVVCDGQHYDAPDASFDTVVSCEAMEHNPAWRETVRNMVRLCRRDGLLILTCATLGRKEHGTTRSLPGDSPPTVGLGWEYYQNLTARDFRESGVLEGLAFHRLFVDWRAHDLYLVGTKTPPDAAQRRKLARIGLHHFRRNFLSSPGWKHFLRGRREAAAAAPEPAASPR